VRDLKREFAGRSAGTIVLESKPNENVTNLKVAGGRCVRPSTALSCDQRALVLI
jgi:hypothetical protein